MGRDDVLPGVGEDGVDALCGGACAADVCREEGRPLGAAREAAAAARDGHRGAVHVHLALARLVEPCPGEDGFPALCLLWDLDFERLARAHGAGADEALDHFEGCAGVVGEGDLAGAAVVVGAGGVADAHGLDGAGGPGLDGGAFGGGEQLVVVLAGVVAAVF